MSEEYRSSREWQALNRIWKALSPGERESVREDFRLVAEYIKAASAPAEKADTPAEKPERPAPRTAPAVRENIMFGLSRPAKALFLGTLTREGFDICAFIDELMSAAEDLDEDGLFDAYVSQRDIEDEDAPALREIIAACLAGRG